MKKILIILGICFLLIVMPAMTVKPMKLTNNVQSIKSILPDIKKPFPVLDDPPEWANGNFTGIWGVTIFGVPTPPIGWISGYYQEIGLGTFAGVFAPFNEINATGAIVGYMLWIFFMGGVQSIATGNGTYVAGIGVANNETHYYMRLHGILGPNYYMYVEYTRFVQ